MPRQVEPQIKQQLTSHLIDQVVSIRQRRRLVEEEWLRSLRAWFNSAIDRHFTSGDTSPNNYNIPMGRRTLERTTVRAAKLLTPNVKWFEQFPVSDLGAKNAANVDKFMWYILKKRIKSRSNINQLVRSVLMYGMAHLKTFVVVRNGQVWPQQRVVDPFAFYIFPETSGVVEDADVVFEDFLISYEKYNSLAQRGYWDILSSNELTKPDWPYHLVERLAYKGITDPTQDISIVYDKVSDNLQRTQSSYISFTEVWLPKDDGLYQCHIVWNVQGGPRIVSFIHSEYDTPLFRSAVHRPLPGELYTTAAMEDIAELSSLSNDTLNQYLDAVTYEQGIMIANALKRHDSWKMKGRALWLTDGDARQDFSFVQPPITSTNQLRATQILWGLIQSLGATGTIAEGQPGRNMPRAGNAVNNLINLGMADVQDISELIEQEILTPSLGDVYKVSTQFMPDDQLVKVPGGQGLFGAILRRRDIIGDYDFEWVGSLQFQDENLRSQRLMIFLNLLPQLTPMLQQQGYVPNMVELVRMIWRYGLGERGLSDVVVPIAQLQKEIQEEMIEQRRDTTVNQQGNGAKGVPGLLYSLPTVTEGFVQR